MSGSAGKLSGDFRHPPSLEASDLLLIRRGLARALPLGEGAGTIGRAAGNVVHVDQTGVRTGHADDDHAVAKQSRVKSGEGGLLATVLGGRGGEHAAHFAYETPFQPALTRLVEKIPHLGGHV